MAAPALLSNFNKLETHGRLYTGGKLEANSESGFVACTCGAEINIVDLKTGRILLTVPAEADEFTAFALSPDGEQLVTAGRSRQFRTWDLAPLASALAKGTAPPEDVECARVWKGHKMPVLDLTYEASGTLVASASADQTAMVFDVEKGACTHVFRGHDAVLHLVRFHPDHSRLRLLTAASDNYVKVWDLHTRACVATLKSHVGLPTSLAFSADGNTLITGGRDQLVSVWRCKDFALVSSITVLEPIEGIVVLGGGGAEGGKAEGGKKGAREGGAARDGAASATLRFVTAGEKGLLRCWDAETGRCLGKQPGGASGAPRPGLTQLVPWGASELLVASSDHNLITHAIGTLAPTRCVAGNNDEITDL